MSSKNSKAAAAAAAASAAEETKLPDAADTSVQEQIDPAAEQTQESTAAPAADPVDESAAEQQQQEPAAPAAPVVEELTPAVAQEAAPADVQESWMSTLSIAGASVLEDVKNYISAMAPGKPQTTDTGVLNQVKLFRAFERCVNLLDDDFEVVFRSLLELIQENREGVFADKRAYRFIPDITLSKEEIHCFQQLLNLFIATADPKGRALALKQISLAVALKFCINDAGRSRLHSFYGV